MALCQCASSGGVPADLAHGDVSCAMGRAEGRMVSVSGIDRISSSIYSGSAVTTSGRSGQMPKDQEELTERIRTLSVVHFDQAYASVGRSGEIPVECHSSSNGQAPSATKTSPRHSLDRPTNSPPSVLLHNPAHSQTDPTTHFTLRDIYEFPHRAIAPNLEYAL